MLDFYQAEALWEFLPGVEAVTLCARIAASTIGQQDTFTAYSLFHAKRLDTDRGEMPGAAVLSDETCTFVLYVDDLQLNAGLADPSPYLTWTLIDQTAGTYTGTTASGNNTVTGIASTAGLSPGMGVVGAGIAAGSTILAVTSSTIVLTQPATASASGVTLTAGGCWVVASLKKSPTRAKWRATCRKAR